jgi:CheY-like chemotaxis protein
VLQGGSVQACSEGVGKGSEFVVRLPALVENRPAVDARRATEPSVPHAPCRVLVVDDHRDSGISLAALLRLGGMEVQVAHDGPSALEAARAFGPEVVLLDIGLPGMDGYEVARRLRAQAATREAVLVAVTGYGQDEDRERSRQAGFEYHLVKPVDLGILQTVFATRNKGLGIRG